MRTVVLHYHLFKNAGTSLDRILQKNFGDRWVTKEFGSNGTNTYAVAKWIRDTPDAVAFSSHTAFGPPPQIEGVRLVTVMLLRDPLERLRSAYRFERPQKANTWGANLAKEFNFDGYIRARLSHPYDRQCRNFQTLRLASMRPEEEGTEFERALKSAEEMTVLGLVERFDDAVAKLAGVLKGAFPDFAWESMRANVSRPSTATEHYMAESPRLTQRLREANSDDLALLDWLRARG